jgi:type II secretory pathway pseudopilin PulG
LLELLIAIAVVAILATVAIPVTSQFRARAQRVQCTTNLRNLYVAADLYLQQNETWPQVDESDDDENSPMDFGNNWIALLKPFGVSEKTWICPTIQELLKNPDLSKSQNLRVDYVATPFDDKPMRPHEWPTQPWFIETGDVHGTGNLIVFTDGSIRDLKTVVATASSQSEPGSSVPPAGGPGATSPPSSTPTPTPTPTPSPTPTSSES